MDRVNGPSVGSRIHKLVQARANRVPGSGPEGLNQEPARIIAVGLDPARRRRWSWWRRGDRQHAAKMLSLASFTPTPVDKEAHRHWVMRHIDELLPQSVDGWSWHKLDARIDNMAGQCIAQVNREFGDYRGGLRQLHDRAHAVVRYQKDLLQEHNQRVAQALSARAASADRLRGDDDEDRWYQPGHSDPPLMSAGWAVSRFYLAALVIAGAADFIVFYKVLQLLLRSLLNVWLLVLVSGFTAIALTLAYYIGVYLRARRAGTRWQHPAMLPGCAVVWVVLGFMAFWVRWKVSGVVAGSVLSAADATLPVPQGNFHGTLPGASMFAVFYFATGTAVITGSYLIYNPLRRAFARTVRAHEAAIRQQTAAVRDLTAAEVECEAIDHQEHAATEVRDSAIEELGELADELKKLARLQLTKQMGGVSATDAFLTDWRVPGSGEHSSIVGDRSCLAEPTDQPGLPTDE